MFEDGSIEGWQLIWSGHKRKARHGVALLLAPHVKIEDFKEYQPARVLTAMIEVKGMRLCILNAYSSTNCSESESAKIAFYSALSKAKVESDRRPRFKQIALGDFNATIASSSKEEHTWNSILGSNNSDRVETNGNGERMLNWCLQHQMKIMNTIFYRTKRIHRGTWRHPLTGRWKRIDYICATPWVAKFIKSCRVHTTASNNFDTDHRLVVATLSFLLQKKTFG